MAATSKQRISGWGRYPATEAVLCRPSRVADITLPEEGTAICRGAGRSYGDAAISSRGVVLLTAELGRLRRFDADSGLLVAEAGTTIDDILRTFVPRGWFPPVTPGTKHVTLGGALAADVHGKNHHRDGSIGNHVEALELLLADGTRRRCGPGEEAGLFWATLGGMGLTGVITEVALRLAPIETPFVVAQNFQAPDLDTAIAWLGDASHDDHYTVAWIDCLSRGRRLGRSVVTRGHHARRTDLPPGALERPRHDGRRGWRIPFDFPPLVLNSASIAAFNQLYYVRQGRRKEPFVTHYNDFFYPLDGISDWNRMYGKRGFLQYQVMIPECDAVVGLRRILERLAASRRASFLAVLKRFGPANAGPLSFPAAGYTLALDLPMTGPDLFALLDELDEIVVRYGGRVYLAKDARLAAGRLAAMYPRLGDWLGVKRMVDPEGRFSSDMSVRLGLDGVG